MAQVNPEIDVRSSPEDAREPLLRQREAADILNVSPRTLEAWRWRGGGPQYLQLSIRCIRYRRSDLEAWERDRERQNTSDPGERVA